MMVWAGNAPLKRLKNVYFLPLLLLIRAHNSDPSTVTDRTENQALADHSFRWPLFGGGYHKFIPVLGRDDTKIAPPGDIFDQPPGEMRWIRDKLADLVGNHVVLSPEELFW